MFDVINSFVNSVTELSDNPPPPPPRNSRPPQPPVRYSVSSVSAVAIPTSPPLTAVRYSKLKPEEITNLQKEIFRKFSVETIQALNKEQILAITDEQASCFQKKTLGVYLEKVWSFAPKRMEKYLIRYEPMPKASLTLYYDIPKNLLSMNNLLTLKHYSGQI